MNQLERFRKWKDRLQVDVGHKMNALFYIWYTPSWKERSLLMVLLSSVLILQSVLDKIVLQQIRKLKF